MDWHENDAQLTDNRPLTEHQRDALGKVWRQCGTEWFWSSSLSRVLHREATLRRLADRGLVQPRWRIDDHDSLEVQWRLTVRGETVARSIVDRPWLGA